VQEYVHKMTLVKNAFAPQKMSTDRLKRVRGYGKFVDVNHTDDLVLEGYNSPFSGIWE